MIEKRSIFSIYLIKLYKTTQKEILFRQYFFNNNVHVLNVNKTVHLIRSSDIFKWDSRVLTKRSDGNWLVDTMTSYVVCSHGCGQSQLASSLTSLYKSLTENVYFKTYSRSQRFLKSIIKFNLIKGEDSPISFR